MSLIEGLSSVAFHHSWRGTPIAFQPTWRRDEVNRAFAPGAGATPGGQPGRSAVALRQVAGPLAGFVLGIGLAAVGMLLLWPGSPAETLLRGEVLPRAETAVPAEAAAPRPAATGRLDERLTSIEGLLRQAASQASASEAAAQAATAAAQRAEATAQMAARAEALSAQAEAIAQRTAASVQRLEAAVAQQAARPEAPSQQALAAAQAAAATAQQSASAAAQAQTTALAAVAAARQAEATAQRLTALVAEGGIGTERFLAATLLLQATINTQRPWLREYQAMVALAPPGSLPRALQEVLASHAARGLPTEAELRERFMALAPELLARAPHQGGMISGFTGSVRGVFASIGFTAPPEPTAQETTIAGIAEHLRRGNLAGAVADAGSLDPGLQPLLAGWLAQARARLAVEQAVQETLLRALSTGRRPA